MLGTTYKQIGFCFDKKIEKWKDIIKYYKKNEKLSFVNNQDHITHKLIVGDNYDALLNLLITHKGMIDIIYIDPPYGKDSLGKFAKTNYENSLTRDGLLSMLYPRLLLSKQLLSEYGVIYCSIDDKNQAYLKCLFDEIFGEQNFIGQIVQNKGNAQNDAINMQKNAEYILVYCKKRKYQLVNGKTKEIPLLQERTLIKKEVFKDENNKYYYKGSSIVTGGQGSTLNARKNLGYTVYYHPITKDKIAICDYNVELAIDCNNEDELYVDNIDLLNKGYIKIRPPKKRNKLGAWTWSLNKFNNEKDKILITKNNSIIQKVFVDENETTLIDGKRYYIKDSLTKNTKSIWEFSSAIGTTQMVKVTNSKDFDNPKNILMLKKLFEIYREKENPIILDFFAGSGSTGQAVMELNKEDGKKRQFILCTLNEITNKTPNGIVYDVTSKRLKRIMSGECYDGSKNFDWIKNNEPYEDNLDVLEIEEINTKVQECEKVVFDTIDETLYDIPKFTSIENKVNWVYTNFYCLQEK